MIPVAVVFIAEIDAIVDGVAGVGRLGDVGDDFGREIEVGASGQVGGRAVGDIRDRVVGVQFGLVLAAVEGYAGDVACGDGVEVGS